MRIYVVEETPEYDRFGFWLGIFNDREEAEKCATDETVQNFAEGYNDSEYSIVDMVQDGHLVSSGIYSVAHSETKVCAPDWELEKKTWYATTIHVLDVPENTPHIYFVQESSTYRHFGDVKACVGDYESAISAARDVWTQVCATYDDEKYFKIEMFLVVEGVEKVVSFCISPRVNDCRWYVQENGRVPYNHHHQNNSAYVIAYQKITTPIPFGETK